MYMKIEFVLIVYILFSYKLLGSNVVEATLEDRLVTVNVSINQRISVRPGDFIGKFFYMSIT